MFLDPSSLEPHCDDDGACMHLFVDMCFGMYHLKLYTAFSTIAIALVNHKVAAELRSYNHVALLCLLIST